MTHNCTRSRLNNVAGLRRRPRYFRSFRKVPEVILSELTIGALCKRRWEGVRIGECSEGRRRRCRGVAEVPKCWRKVPEVAGGFGALVPK